MTAFNREIFKFNGGDALGGFDPVFRGTVFQYYCSCTFGTGTDYQCNSLNIVFLH